MNIATFQITTTHKGSGNSTNLKAYAKDLLLVTNRVQDFYTDPAGAGTVFWYDERPDRQVPAVMYKTNMTSEAFHAKILEAENEQWLYLEVVEEKDMGNGRKIIPSVLVRRVNIEQIIKAYDISTTQSYLYIRRGAAFNVLRLKTTHTIDEIDAVASESFSISASGV